MSYQIVDNQGRVHFNNRTFSTETDASMFLYHHVFLNNNYFGKIGDFTIQNVGRQKKQSYKDRNNG